MMPAQGGGRPCANIGGFSSRSRRQSTRPHHPRDHCWSPRTPGETTGETRGSSAALLYSPLSPESCVVWARTNQPPKQRAWTRKRPLSTNKHTQKKAPSYLLDDGVWYLFDRVESDNSRPPVSKPSGHERHLEARVHLVRLSLSRGLHPPFPCRHSSHSVHSSQVMRVSECETLMSARRS